MDGGRAERGHIRGALVVTITHHYDFHEGSGTSISDVVGSSDFDTFPVGATWTDDGLAVLSDTANVDLGKVLGVVSAPKATFSCWLRIDGGQSTGFKTCFPLQHGDYTIVAMVDFGSGQVNIGAGYEVLIEGFNWDTDGRTFPVGEWHHLALSPDAATDEKMYLYLDGVKGSAIWGLSGHGPANGSDIKVPGQPAVNAYTFVIDDIRIHSGLATDQDISDEYALGRSAGGPTTVNTVSEVVPLAVETLDQTAVQRVSEAVVLGAETLDQIAVHRMSQIFAFALETLDAPTGPAVSVWTGGAEVPATATVWSGGAEVATTVEVAP